MNQARSMATEIDGMTIFGPDGRPAWETVARNQWYEGSRWSPNRSFIWFPLQEPKRDLDRFTRTELAKASRYLYKNSPFIRGIVERIVTIVVGAGFIPSPESSNPKWNDRFELWYNRKAKNIHLGARASMAQYQRATFRAKLVDGSCFSVKTDDSVSLEAKIQGIEMERIVGSLADGAQSETNTFSGGVDGQNLNEQGIVQSYNIKGAKNPYLAQYVVHHFTPGRLGQYWGEGILWSAINTARDIDDIIVLEKQCVKDASATKNVIKTASGQLNPESFMKMRVNMGGTAAAFPFNLPNDDSAKTNYYKTVIGADSVVLRHGDEFTPYKPERPGAAWTGFMDFLSQTVCLSTGFPASVVFPVDIGGTDIRRDLEIAQRVADSMQDDLLLEFDEILDYLVDVEVADGVLGKDCPPDYKLRSWHCPPKINVDRQQAKEDRADVAVGLMSRAIYHGRYGGNARKVDLAVMKEAKDRAQDIKDAGFASVEDFLKVLSLDARLLQAKGTPEKGTQE